MFHSSLSGRLKCIISALVLCCSSGALNAASVCTSGVNWVGSCTAGTETLTVSMVFGLDTDLDGLNATDVVVQFDGTMTVTRSAPYAAPGSVDPSYLDRIDTEIVSMSLTGASPYVAGWTMQAGVNEGLAPTLGYISEFGDPISPTSRFDMVFKFENTPFGTLHHNGSFFFSTQITQSPEIGAVYNHTGCCFGTLFDLFDSNNVNVLQITDQFGTDYGSVGRPELTITGTVVPLPAPLLLMLSGLVGLVGVARRKRQPSC